MSDLNPYEEGLAMELARARERIKELEAKLEKAMEDLGIIATYRKKCHDYDDDVGHDLRAFEEEDVERLEVIARTALAELKGGKDDPVQGIRCAVVCAAAESAALVGETND